MLGCTESKKPEITPWGEDMNAEAIQTGRFSLTDIQESGEMIMLTMSGPDSYFDYHGREAGTQFLLCQRFAQQIGVSLRVEVCKTTDEIMKKLRDGEGDIAAFQMPKDGKDIVQCGYRIDSLHTGWAVSRENSLLADTIDRWYKPSLLASVKQEERLMYSTGGVHRRTYAPMLDSKTGRISQYDHLFMRYAPVARWDWRLIAAQCYQESCFDPKAYSWAGARGLMQIMPATAAHLGLAESKMYDPEENIFAATRYIAELSSKLQDIRNPMERQMFVLGSYNGGLSHIRDAMALARKHGKDPQRWADVEEFVLKLSTPTFYNDPVVRSGYMRGQETADYVRRIRDRWAQYRGSARAGTHGGGPLDMMPGGDSPHKARRSHRFKL